MKRYFISLDSIADYTNLVMAFHKAARAKRYRPEVQIFLQNFNQNIYALSQLILKGKMPLGSFRAFQIRDPKPRLIHAACFEDRIFHHAVMNQAGEILDRSMSPFSYACRPNKGIHSAILQVQSNLQGFEWYGKIDIAGYFATIDHVILLSILQRKFKGELFIGQLERIVASYQATQDKGLPIGSLTSQYFANFYLDGLDRFLEQHPLVSAYVRYMDDVVWWCREKTHLKITLAAIEAYLHQQRHLVIKEQKQLQASRQGICYCGFHVTQGAIRLSKRRKQRFLERRQYWEGLYQQDMINPQQLQRAYAATQAMTAHTDSLAWRRENLRRFPALDV